MAIELSVLCRPAETAAPAGVQADTLYRGLVASLAAERASFRHLTGETLFLRDIGRDLPEVLAVRRRRLTDVDGTDCSSPLVCVEQAPLEDGVACALAASAVIPRHGDGWSVRDVGADAPCPCESCARSGARIVTLGDQTSLHTTNVHGDAGGDAFAQAWSMFCAAERLLARCGMEFRDVVRTWIHLRDIDRDYDALNRARRAFFTSRGITQRPASTGVQGGPPSDVHDCSMSLTARRTSTPPDVTPMSTTLLNEAWTYGADFSRGLRVADANKVALHVSGTASVDETGCTVHVGDFAAQAARMLDNVAALLAEQGATFAHVGSGVTYLKRAGDAAALQTLCRERGFVGFPWAVVHAPLCRPELLCETEAVAMLSLGTARG